MSRSRRKTKIYGITTADSEKEDKRKANRKLRRLSKEKLKGNAETLPLLREVSNVWDFAKDGKKYDPKITDKLMRK